MLFIVPVNGNHRLACGPGSRVSSKLNDKSPSPEKAIHPCNAPSCYLKCFHFVSQMVVVSVVNPRKNPRGRLGPFGLCLGVSLPNIKGAKDL